MKKELKISAIIGYFNIAANTLVSLLFIPFMLKTMGQSEYGLYSLVASIIAYLSVLDMGFGNAMIRFVARSKAKKDDREPKINGLFLFLYSIIGALTVVVGIILVNNTNTIFGNSLTVDEIEKAKILIIILTASVAASFPLSIFDSYIISNEKFIFSKTLAIIKTIAKPLFMIPLLLIGYKSIAMTTVVASVNILLHIVSLVYCFKKLKMKIAFSIKNIDKTLLKEIGGYSFFVFLSLIVDNVFNNTDQVILGIVSGTIAVSVYAVAHQVNQMNVQCSTAISSLFLPKITKTLEEKNADKKISDIFIKVSRIQIYIMSLLLFGFIVFGKYFVSIWAGPEYEMSYYIILILIVPSIIPLTQNIGISVIQAKNQHQFRSIVYIIIAVFNIAITIPLAKMYQGIGAAIGTALANLCGQIIAMNIFYYKKAKLDIPKYWKFLLRMLFQYSLLSALTIVAMHYIGFSIATFIIGIIIFFILFAVINYINMNQDEKADLSYSLNKIIPKKLRRTK
ncbi:oligosaccharide flippase family protein [Candidatus Saccharibacteria bacterium]|nr:oligosaccharide flippase family protein [Candidatus Saccharibacteria bacterium]